MFSQLDSSLKRLHTEDNNRQPCLLSSDIMSGSGTVELLKFLGFHFQVKSGNFVMYNFLVNGMCATD